MMIKGKKIENRTILIISAIILIILAGYYIVINLPSEANYLSVEEVLRNKDMYINSGTIVIRGYYDSNAIAIVSTPSDIIGKPTLDLDPYGVENYSDILRNDVKFDFTGHLLEINVGGPDNKVIFKAVKIEIV